VENTIIEFVKWFLAKSDPLLAACILLLGYWNYKINQKIDEHIDAKNKHPHPCCEWGEKSYQALKDSLDQQHEENRNDHREILNMVIGEINGRSKSNP